MSVRVGTGISTEQDSLAAGPAAAQAAAAGLGGAPADLALVFASGTHLIAPEATLELGQPPLAHPLRRRRTETELGQRGAQI